MVERRSWRKGLNTLHVHTADGGKSYTLNVHTAILLAVERACGVGKRYTLYVHTRLLLVFYLLYDVKNR
jgi:hypothetical protein